LAINFASSFQQRFNEQGEESFFGETNKEGFQQLNKGIFLAEINLREGMFFKIIDHLKNTMV
jgi:hypothetical protein